MDKIIITVSGGVVQDVSNVPFGVEVEIHDYDVDGLPGIALNKDDNGDHYITSFYRHLA